MNFFTQAKYNHIYHLLLKAGLALLVVLTVMFVVMTVNQIRKGKFIGEAADIQNTITVTGTGEATAVPDSARFSVGVTHEAETVAKAQTQSTEAINKIISYLKENGVSEKNIKTVNYNVSPRYQYQETQGIPRPPKGERQLAGYEVSQQLEVTVHDTNQAGKLLSGVGERGADSVSDLSFVVSDENKLKQKAQVNAIANARENARELAKALGVTLGEVVSYSQTGNIRPIEYEQATLDSAAGRGGGEKPQVPAGENRVRTEASVTFAIN